MQRNEQEWIEIGYVAEAHGLRGDVYAVLFSEPGEWIESWPELHIRPRGTSGAPQQSFPLVCVSPHKKGQKLVLEGVKDRTQAEALCGWTILLPAEVLVAESGTPPYLREIKGFQVVDQRLGNLGQIEDFSSNGSQDLLVVGQGSGRFEFPFVKAFVSEMDFSRRQLLVDLPEGLVEINRAL